MSVRGCFAGGGIKQDCVPLDVGRVGVSPGEGHGGVSFGTGGRLKNFKRSRSFCFHDSYSDIFIHVTVYAVQK